MALLFRGMLAQGTPTLLAGHYLHCTWPDEMCEEQPIYFHGKPMPTFTTRPCPASVCVGICTHGGLPEPGTPLTRVEVCVQGLCLLASAATGRAGTTTQPFPGINATVIVNCGTLGQLVHIERRHDHRG